MSQQQLHPLSGRTFYRVVGAGNSFWFHISDAAALKDDLDCSQAARVLCQSHDFAPADGYVVLYVPSRASKTPSVPQWSFYNADGSYAGFCGNAARCCAAIIQDQDLDQHRQGYFISDKGPISFFFDGALVKIEMPLAGVVEQRKVHCSRGEVSGHFVDTGVPHFLIEGSKNFELAKEIRGLEVFPEGTNVTFFSEATDGTEKFAQAVTYERGVENFTLACGTGAVAVGLYLMQKNKTAIQQVRMPGGDLVVSMNAEKTRPTLTGSAVIQYSMTIKDGVWEKK